MKIRPVAAVVSAISLFLGFIAPISAEEKYTLFEHEVLPAIRGLWPIMTAACGSNKHELELPPEQFAKPMTQALADVYTLTKQQRMLLMANKPIRDSKKYLEMIDAFPEKQWGAESKKKIKEWFSVETRKEGEKEAMLALLVIFEPQSDPKKVANVKTTDTSESRSEKP